MKRSRPLPIPVLPEDLDPSGRALPTDLAWFVPRPPPAPERGAREAEAA